MKAPDLPEEVQLPEEWQAPNPSELPVDNSSDSMDEIARDIEAEELEERLKVSYGDLIELYGEMDKEITEQKRIGNLPQDFELELMPVGSNGIVALSEGEEYNLDVGDQDMAAKVSGVNDETLESHLMHSWIFKKFNTLLRTEDDPIEFQYRFKENSSDSEQLLITEESSYSLLNSDDEFSVRRVNFHHTADMIRNYGSIADNNEQNDRIERAISFELAENSSMYDGENITVKKPSSGLIYFTKSQGGNISHSNREKRKRQIRELNEVTEDNFNPWLVYPSPEDRILVNNGKVEVNDEFIDANNYAEAISSELESLTNSNYSIDSEEHRVAVYDPNDEKVAELRYSDSQISVSCGSNESATKEDMKTQYQDLARIEAAIHNAVDPENVEIRSEIDQIYEE
ncbi:MAG: hypothetical protein ABEJ99_03835 [Candidatus Nanohaloarchaea archaeon]